MKIIAKTGNPDIAEVYIAEMRGSRLIEFVESVQPPIPKKKKHVLIISTLFGCPVKCKICDAGDNYFGKLTKSEIISQIDFLIHKNYPEGNILTETLKIQFARMGEPTLNPAVLEVLEELPFLYKYNRLVPSVSTIAPAGSEDFLIKLKKIKDKYYQSGFQLQFSVHSTDEQQRDYLIPVKKLALEEIADFGNNFFDGNDRKVTLNFAVSTDSIIEPKKLGEIFSTDRFFIKLTPVNPTYKSKKNNIVSLINPYDVQDELINSLRCEGFEVLLSYGETEENLIGSNCGQHIMNYIGSGKSMKESYTYQLEDA